MVIYNKYLFWSFRFFMYVWSSSTVLGSQFPQPLEWPERYPMGAPFIIFGLSSSVPESTSDGCLVIHNKPRSITAGFMPMRCFQKAKFTICNYNPILGSPML